ncbi:calcium-binding protein [Methylobacillus glycogenes]|nr:calcium-binding protein [Methylobacillus glycogenes]
MDLELNIKGSSDIATISNWFAGSEFQRALPVI